MTSIYSRILFLISVFCLARRPLERLKVKERSKFELKITARPSATFRN